MVFYHVTNSNNEYCEANRFYQAINFGIPIETGNNASMDSLLKEYGLGVALVSDERYLEEIKSAIYLLLLQYNQIKKSCLKM